MMAVGLAWAEPELCCWFLLKQSAARTQTKTVARRRTIKIE